MRVTRQLIGLALALGLAARPVTGGDVKARVGEVADSIKSAVKSGIAAKAALW